MPGPSKINSTHQIPLAQQQNQNSATASNVLAGAVNRVQPAPRFPATQRGGISPSTAQTERATWAEAQASIKADSKLVLQKIEDLKFAGMKPTALPGDLETALKGYEKWLAAIEPERKVATSSLLINFMEQVKEKHSKLEEYIENILTDIKREIAQAEAFVAKDGKNFKPIELGLDGPVKATIKKDFYNKCSGSYAVFNPFGGGAQPVYEHNIHILYGSPEDRERLVGQVKIKWLVENCRAQKEAEPPVVGEVIKTLVENGEIKELPYDRIVFSP